MNTRSIIAIILTSVMVTAAFSQKPRPEGPPRGEGPRHDWVKDIDTNKNGIIEPDEFQAAIDRTFAEIDKNGNGVIDANEIPRFDKRENGPPPPMGPGDGMRPGMRPVGPPLGGQPGGMNGIGPGQMQGELVNDHKLLPPFFFMDKLQTGGTLTKAEFERAAKEVFVQMDTNHDGMLSREESRSHRVGKPGSEGPPPPPPNAMFIAAELRFGDKLVEGQPFSAETVIEDTRRLYDGSTVTKRIAGPSYRVTAGRTRREQPIEIGGFEVMNGNNKPQTLIFINDFPAKTQYFLDDENKVARKHRLDQTGRPDDMPGTPKDAKTESLGSKTIEGVSVDGTRIISEIPVGHLGNDKPIQVITENWYSPELQVIVMSRHVDPLSGEHVFRLVNIKRSEPSADLFIVPAGYRIESGPGSAQEK